MDNESEETSDTDERRELGKTAENMKAIKNYSTERACKSTGTSKTTERACEATGTSQPTPFIPSEIGALNLSRISSSYQPNLQRGDYQFITNLLLRY